MSPFCVDKVTFECRHGNQAKPHYCTACNAQFTSKPCFDAVKLWYTPNCQTQEVQDITVKFKSPVKANTNDIALIQQKIAAAMEVPIESVIAVQISVVTGSVMYEGTAVALKASLEQQMANHANVAGMTVEVTMPTGRRLLVAVKFDVTYTSTNITMNHTSFVQQEIAQAPGVTLNGTLAAPTYEIELKVKDVAKKTDAQITTKIANVITQVKADVPKFTNLQKGTVVKVTKTISVKVNTTMAVVTTPQATPQATLPGSSATSFTLFTLMAVTILFY